MEKESILQEDPSVAGRLDSWKEIATYLGREVRTVQRWEKQEGLPVHRHLHEKQGTVYAFKGELDAWIRSRRATEKAPESTVTVESALPLVTGPHSFVERSSPRSWRLGIAMMLSIAIFVGYMAYSELRQSRQSPSRRIKLAVLPFQNLSGQPDQDYFSDGMTEEMITELARVEPDKVGLIGRTSVMHYKGTSESLSMIGKELGVDYLLEGSVRRGSSRTRVTAQLIRVSDQTHLWAETYDSSESRPLSTQTEVAKQITESLIPKLLPGQVTNSTKQRLAALGTSNSDASDAYLKGRYALNRANPDDYDLSIQYFNEALKQDPNFAQAYEGLAEAYTQIGYEAVRPGNECFPKAEQAARKALELDGTLGEAHSVIALSEFLQGWNWKAAEAEFRRSIELNPNLAEVHHNYAQFLSFMGRHDEALKEVKLAQELEPLSAVINSDAGWFYFRARRYDEAVAESRKVLQLEPTFGSAQFCIVNSLEKKGDYEQARAETIKMLKDQNRLNLVPGVNAPDPKEALRNVNLWRIQRMEQLGNGVYISPFSWAYMYAVAGDVNKSIEWLEVAYKDHDIGMVQLKVNPALDDLKGDPRFADLVKRVGLPS